MIDLDNFPENQIKILKNLICQKQEKQEKQDICNDWIGRYVIIRTYSAGVHCGILSKKVMNEVILTNARRIWSWSGAFTLSAIAEHGVSKDSKLSITIPEIKLTEIEIIPCTAAAISCLQNIKEYCA